MLRNCPSRPRHLLTRHAHRRCVLIIVILLSLYLRAIDGHFTRHQRVSVVASIDFLLSLCRGHLDLPQNGQETPTETLRATLNFFVSRSSSFILIRIVVASVHLRQVGYAGLFSRLRGISRATAREVAVFQNA